MKEAKKERARVEAQEAERKKKNMEIQEQAKQAPIPSLDEIPEGGEWRGPGLCILFSSLLSSFYSLPLLLFLSSFFVL